MTMLRLLPLRLLILCALTIAGHVAPGSAFAKGADGSGGGSLLTLPDGKKVLLDLYLRQPGRIPEMHVQAPLPETPFFKASTFEVLAIQETAAFALVRDRLTRWESHAPKLVGLLATIAQSFPRYFYTLRPIPQYHGYYLPPDSKLNKQQIETVIYYDPIFGPILNAAAWSQVEVPSQAGLIIHESLRYAQLNLHADLSDKQIQDITATLMLEEPRDGLEGADVVGEKLATTFRVVELSPLPGHFPFHERVLLRLTAYDLVERSKEIHALLENASAPYKEFRDGLRAMRRMAEKILKIKEMPPSHDSYFKAFVSLNSADSLTLPLSQECVPEDQLLCGQIAVILQKANMRVPTASNDLADPDTYKGMFYTLLGLEMKLGATVNPNFDERTFGLRNLDYRYLRKYLNEGKRGTAVLSDATDEQYAYIVRESIVWLRDLVDKYFTFINHVRHNNLESENK